MGATTDIESGEAALGKSNLHKLYDGRFYERQVATAIESAEIYLKFLWQLIQPRSVLDVGCGRGAWLKVCHDLGSTALFGFDGDWNSQSLMIDSAIKFQAIDLFRARFWGEEKVCYWYRQNTFLYVRRDSPPYEQLKARGLSEIENVAFINCVHPELLAWQTASYRGHVGDLMPSLWRAILRRLG